MSLYAWNTSAGPRYVCESEDGREIEVSAVVSSPHTRIPSATRAGRVKRIIKAIPPPVSKKPVSNEVVSSEPVSKETTAVSDTKTENTAEVTREDNIDEEDLDDLLEGI